MKKFLFLMLLIACCMSANAQVTYNVRVGGGFIGKITPTHPGYLGEKECFALNAQVQSNIPFQKNSKWTFSPSVAIGYQLKKELRSNAMQFYAPLQIGYKAPIKNAFLFPKLGVALGYQTGVNGTFSDNDDINFSYIRFVPCEVKGSAIVGPAVSLDLEINHFVVGLNAFYSVTKQEYDYEINEFAFDFSDIVIKPSNYGIVENKAPIYGVYLNLGYKF